MNSRWYLVLCGSTFLFGMLTWAYFAHILIINWPHRSFIQHATPNTAATKQTKKLWFWQHGRWHHDDIELLWGNDVNTNIACLLNRWLTLLEEEEITTRHIIVQTALHTNDNSHLYISFDRHPLSKQWSTHAKWYWVEGLLKTVRENDCPAEHITFLVQHQPMYDPHLNLGVSWPMHGFLD